MNEAAEKRQKRLTQVPMPPEACSKREAEHFKRIATDLLKDGVLYEDQILKVAELASTEVWRENVANRRKRLREALKLQNDIDPNLKLRDPEVFAGRVDSYLVKAKTVEEAYEMAEQDYVGVFRERKYSSYNSYRNARREREQKKCKDLA